MDEEEAKARLRLLELEEEESLSVLETAGGVAQSIGQGLLPFYDEIGSGVRAVGDPSLYDGERSIGERYDLAQEQASNSLRNYKEENPNTQFAIEATSGFASPINKLGNVGQVGTGLYNTVKSLGRNAARNATEGAIYGYGFGENDGDSASTEEITGWSSLDNLLNSDRFQTARDTAEIAAAFGTALDTGARTVAKGLDGLRLKNEVRADVPVPDVPNVGKQPPIKGETTPIHISNPRSVRAGVMRQGLGRLPGANEALVEQSIPTIERARASVADAELDFTNQGRNLDTLQRQRDIDLDAEQMNRSDAIAGNQRDANAAIDARINAEADDLRRQSTAAEDIRLESEMAELNAIDEREAAAGLNKAIAADELARTDVEQQISQRADNARAYSELNSEVLQNSVPEGRREKITATGKQGFNQVYDEVNAAYDDAWSVDELSAGTMDDVVKQAEAAAVMLGEADSRLLNRIIKDAKKIQKAGGNLSVLDELVRGAIDTTEDQIVRKDLESLRETLRSGLPEANRVKLQAVDDVYPTYLVAQRASAAADGGIPTPEQYQQASGVVGGRSRRARGETPMIERIQQDIDLTPKPIGEPKETVPSLQKARALELEKAAIKDATQKAGLERSREAGQSSVDRKRATEAERGAVAEQARIDNQAESRRAKLEGRDQALINSGEKQRLGDVKEEILGPLKLSRDKTLADAKIPNESLYMAALLAGVLPGSAGLAPKAGSIISGGRKMVSPDAQRALAFQGDKTKKLAEYIRSGRSEYVTRAAALAAGKLKDEDREYR